jgi:hypothetical protein
MAGLVRSCRRAVGRDGEGGVEQGIDHDGCSVGRGIIVSAFVIVTLPRVS